MTSPDISESWIDPIFNAIMSDVLASGHFVQVNVTESEVSPSYGLTANLWLQEMRPVGQISGLASSSGLLVFVLRIYCAMTMSPGDEIDPKLTRAASNLMRRWHDDYDFGGVCRNVDLLGITGTQLRYNAGYYYDEKGDLKFRIGDITIPVIVDDIWPQIN